MSKPVRIKDYVASRVEEVAVVERRSFANMVEVLLLQALERAEIPMARPGAALVVGSSAAAATVSGMKDEAETLALRDGRCTADVARGTRCKLCGKVH